MKKLFVLLLVLCLAFTVPVSAEEALLSREKAAEFAYGLLEKALSAQAVDPAEDEQGGYRFSFDGFSVIAAENTLSAESRILAVEVTGQDIAVPRGVGPGSSLEDLLYAFPLDNASLTGAWDEAVLYIRGSLPAEVQAAVVQRDGSRISQVEYDLYSADGSEAVLTCLRFALEQDTVVSLRADLDIALSYNDAVQELDRLSSLQEDHSYTAYREKEPAPLAREDLLFGPVDFVSADGPGLVSLLGSPSADTWEEAENGWLRTMEWEGLQVVLACGSRQDPGTLALLSLYGGSLEGPRGIRIDDTLNSVLSRLPAGDGTLLYGDGQEMPYGILTEGAEGPSLQLGIPVEDGQVQLTLDFVDGLLWVMTCSLL